MQQKRKTNTTRKTIVLFFPNYLSFVHILVFERIFAVVNINVRIGLFTVCSPNATSKEHESWKMK